MPSTPWSTPLEEWQFLLARELAEVFLTEGWEARDGAVRFRGRLLVDPERAFAVLSERLRPLGYVPQLLRPDEVVLLRLAPARRGVGLRGWALPAALFVATLLSTLFVGGIAYAASIMGILVVHELGHYVTGRLYGMRVSLPYFIPMPISLMGTMGAVIRMRSPVPDRRALFDVGIAGPLAGLAVAVPVTILGLHLSRVVPDVPDLPGVLRFGEPLLFKALTGLVFGTVPSGQTVLLHPVAYAGWLGFLVTALNLIPAGQLDGGHVAYAVLGRRHDKVALMTVFALFGMALYTTLSTGQLQMLWAIWGVLLLILGYRHPPPLNDLTPVDPIRRTIGILSWGLFLALVTPVPIQL
jgi:membrane-associated protease RseP (regulator of RpoE activity)